MTAVPTPPNTDAETIEMRLHMFDSGNEYETFDVNDVRVLVHELERIRVTIEERSDSDAAVGIRSVIDEFFDDSPPGGYNALVTDAVLAVPSVASALTLRQMVIDAEIDRRYNDVTLPGEDPEDAADTAVQLLARLRAVVEENPL